MTFANSGPAFLSLPLLLLRFASSSRDLRFASLSRGIRPASCASSWASGSAAIHALYSFSFAQSVHTGNYLRIKYSSATIISPLPLWLTSILLCFLLLAFNCFFLSFSLSTSARSRLRLRAPQTVCSQPANLIPPALSYRCSALLCS